jgi:outer membrane protein TolC
LVLLLAVCLAGLTGANAAAETLEQAWSLALQVNSGLKSKKESTAAASSMLDSARAKYLPSLSLEAGYTALDSDPKQKADLLGYDLEMPYADKDSGDYKVKLTLPVFTGWRIERGIDAASASLQAAKQDEAGSVQDLKIKVAQAYVNVLRASHVLKVAKSHVESLEAHVRDVQNLRREGMVAKSDLLSAQVALADARQKALQATNGLDLAKAAYNMLMDRPLDQAVNLDELSPEPAEDNLEQLTEQAISQRSEMAALASQVESLRNQAEAVRGEYWPQLGLAGGYAYQENSYQVHEGKWFVTVGLEWSIFDGGVIRHKAGAVDRQAAAVDMQRDEVGKSIRLQVRQAWLDVRETCKRIKVTESAVAQSTENLRVARDRYKNGLSTHTEVLDAETLRINSDTNHANAVFDAVMAGLRLKRATGEL